MEDFYADWLDGKSPDQQEYISELWPAALDSPEVLPLYLAAAKHQCIAYAPPLPAGHKGIPAAWILAQVMQARALARAGVLGTDGEAPYGMESVTVFPMDWTVKRLLNPEKRLGGIA